MKPICVKCERFMRPKKNNFAFVEGMWKSTAGKTIVPYPTGKGSDEHWTGYKLWFGDLWECPTCSQQIIVGVAQQPLREHYMPDFSEKVETYNGMQLLVKDC